MKNNSNIYDIDRDLIRSINDTHKWTVEDAQKRIDFYTKKIEELPENDKKIDIYRTYIANLNRYIWKLYSEMSKPELNKYLTLAQNATTEDQIKKAINELKEEIENETEKPVTQEDMLIDREEPSTPMEEYVAYEEVNGDQTEGDA